MSTPPVITVTADGMTLTIPVEAVRKLIRDEIVALGGEMLSHADERADVVSDEGMWAHQAEISVISLNALGGYLLGREDRRHFLEQPPEPPVQ